jgi:hypothetical protein
MSSTPTDDPRDPRIVAAIDLLGRTGVEEVQVRYCEEEQPVVWMALGTWKRGKRTATEVGAGLTPWRAMFRLCEAVMDGGTCTHCKRPTMVDDQPAAGPLAGLAELLCAYRYDPELRTFRRACEGRVK